MSFIIFKSLKLMEDLTMPLTIGAVSLMGLVAYFLVKRTRTQLPKQQASKPSQTKPQKQTNQSQNSQQQPGETQPKDKKKKPKKKKVKQQPQPSAFKTIKQIQQTYAQLYYGQISLKPQPNSIYTPTSICYKNSKILVGTTKNELTLYDLKKWKKDDPKSLEKYFVSLDNNTPTAVFIGTKYYYAALNFDRNVVYYEFLGEKGQYFQEVKRFPRNLLKSDASAIWVPQDEKFIITAGSQADTTLNVWSMKGEKLQTFNTYQIEHYDIICSLNTFMVRGWTSEVKLFNVQTDKTGGFLKIEKGYNLSIPDQAICSSMDNLAMYGLTVSKEFKTTLWNLNSLNPQKMELKVIEPYEIDLDEIESCLVHTLKDENERYKTLIIFSDKSKIVICDRDFTVHQTIVGVECKSLQIIGSMKNVVLITQTKQGKLIVWNLTKLVQKFQQYYKE